MLLYQFFQTFIPAVEIELQAAIDRANGPNLTELRYMLAYHMGWEGPGAGPDARGKRIRPMLVLLTTAAAGGDWKNALPAASAVELIHNFSLIHDDIEDNSSHRRGRPTVWKKWSVAQATNAGDALFSLAQLEILRLVDTLTSPIVVRAASVLNQTCLHLTQGQYLDLSYEQRLDLTERDYWPMIEGKTSALLASCTEIGAMIAQAPELVYSYYHQFGYYLGLAFQAQDDILGVWGDATLTGKSNQSDLVTGKKTLPVLYGLQRKGEFHQRWIRGSISPKEAVTLANLLAEEGAKEYSQQQVDQLTNQAISALDSAQPKGEAGAALYELAKKLLNRSS
jgi:geranylgeranyl diphosphate synthase type I